MARGGIDIVELGFRFTDKSKFYGPYAHTSEAFLETLSLPEGPIYGVMLNASDYLTENMEEDLKRNFVPAAESPISLVRIAAHIKHIPHAAPLVAYLKDLGYMVGLNIMQISQASDEKIASLIETIENEYVEFEALYFADSLGNMRPDDISRVTRIYKQHSGKAIGFHGHDNINLGVTNSLRAIEEGVTWIDATVTGMGRGAGNTQTEYLATELKARGLADVKCMHIHQAATGQFSEMQAEYGWGTNLFYYQAGLKAVHPTYVQQMLTSKRFEPIDILSMIDSLGNSDVNLSYSDKNIEAAFASFLSDPNGTTDVSGLWEGRPVILIANGPNGRRHWKAVKDYANRHDAVLLAVNLTNFVDPTDIDAVVCVHPARMLAFTREKDWFSTRLITSHKAIPDDMRDVLTNDREIIDYGVSIETGKFDAKETGCILPAPLAVGAALAVSRAAGASEVLLAGFDGFDGKSRDFEEMSDLLATVKESGLFVSSLTKTHYNLPMVSLYGISVAA